MPILGPTHHAIGLARKAAQGDELRLWALANDNRSAERSITLKTINVAIVLVLCMFSGAAFTQTREDKCAPDIYEAAKRHLKVSEFAPRQDGGNVISAACRIWPYKTNLLLAAFAYDEGVEYEKQLVVLILDHKKRYVISGYRRDIAEDAVTEVGEYSLKLDTARYQLAEGVRAFGIRFNSSANGANCGDGYWSDELTLFVAERKKLRPVLSLNLSQQRWLRGCPTATAGALWEDALLTIGTADTITNGFRDLVVNAKITVNSEGAPNGDHKDHIERHTLHYDGKTYKKGQSVSWWLTQGG